MAASKTLKSKTLAIEVQNGTDKAGIPTYTKKAFSGVKLDATDDAVYNTAQAIKAVMGKSTKDIYLNEVEVIANV